MLSALINGCAGTALTLAIGSQVLGMTLPQAALCVLASNVGGFLALLVIMWGSWVRGTFPTWALFLGTYFGTLFLLAEPYRSVRAFVWLALPLMLSAGFCIIAYGPVQDWFVARSQRRQRSA